MRWTTITCLAVFIATATSGGAVTVFDTMGPNNTYDQNAGYTVVSALPGIGLVESAAQFTAQAGGPLTEVDLGLTTQSNTLAVFPPVNVYLTADDAGKPDNLSEIFLGTVTPTQFFGSTNNSLVSLTSINASVDAGSTYWLVLKPGSNSPLFDAWNQSSPSVAGTQDFSQDDSNWNNAGSTLAAFRISAVPEPSTLRLLATAALLYLVRRGRRTGFNTQS